MKILVHIHSMNDADVITQSLSAVKNLTFPVDEVLLVDNGSTDRTVDLALPFGITLIRNENNTGTSGAVRAGFEYALKNGYDWIWVFDADTAPRANALDKLFELYHSFSEDIRQKVFLLASLPLDFSTQRLYHGIKYTDKGFNVTQPPPGQTYCQIHGTIWTGSLYNLALVKQMGLPRADYMLDWAEYEYGYQGLRLGLLAYMHYESIVDHNIGGAAALHYTKYQFGPLKFHLKEKPAFRCYYFVRNTVYFWLYEYNIRNVRTMGQGIITALKLSFGFIIRFPVRWPQFMACMRGFWDGIFKNIDRRY